MESKGFAFTAKIPFRKKMTKKKKVEANVRSSRPLMYIPGTNSMIWPEICWITLRDIEKCATLRRNKCIERPTALISQRCHRPAPWETNLLRLNQTFNFVARDYKMHFMDFLVVPRKRLENRRWKKEWSEARERYAKTNGIQSGIHRMFLSTIRFCWLLWF